MTIRQKYALGSGFVGLLLVVIGLKFVFQWDIKSLAPLKLNGEPALLFFTVEQPCECMQELVQKADEQIAEWPELQRSNIPIIRIDFDTRRDLVSQYNVFRAPCLLLLDSQGEIVYRQDYPLTEGGPFKLADFETQIQNVLISK